MFLKTVIKQGIKILELQKENKALYEENKQNREDIEDKGLQVLHAKALAEKTLDALENLQEIDRQGILEESKRRQRNTVINYLRCRNLDIIKELSSTNQSFR